jgi:AcrR family transcriptional regulator
MTHRTRRRAGELADAIRAATLAELADHGYAGVTYEGVARRVRTSKPVLYRRYRSRGQMVLDAVTPHPTGEITHIDTGSLRGDLIALLEQIAARVQHVGIEAYHGIIGESGDSLADTVAEIDGGTSQKMRKILDTAHVRGEIGPGPLPDRVVLLPVVMLRHDVLFRHLFDPASITDMIDSVYLPLVKAVSTPPGTSTPANGEAGMTVQPRLDDDPAAAGPGLVSGR